ncbi:hypothetical protein AYO38_07885 [bacterium SCGC AG-212-C10]|nr:hypothetical protein AYO38_07885 [bacterium SCGC AG-212-C10]
MDNDFSLDLADIASTIRTSELVAMRFVSVGQRLLLDFRYSDVDGPMVRVVPPVKSIEERYETLKRWRPRFAPPEKIHAVWWPRFARSLGSTGIWDEVMTRVSDTGDVDSTRRAAAALDELIQLELEQQRAAVRGEGFKTMWSARAARL